MKFSTMKNRLFKKEGDPLFIARSRVSSRITMEQVVESLAHESSLTKGDITSVLVGLEKVVAEFIIIGHSVDLGFISLSYSIKGGFNSGEEGFQKDRNWISITSNVASSFKKLVNQKAKPVKVNSENKGPQPNTLTKVSGNKSKPEIQPGNLLRIAGSKLAFDETDLETGVFLKPQTGTAVRISEYAKTGNSVILCKLPEKAKPGINKLEVRTRTGDGEIIAGTMEGTVMIAA